jgi:hypothetical protein
LKKKVSIIYSELKQKSLQRKELTMVDMDTFVTRLYVMIDDFCQSQWQQEPRQCGPDASLSRSEVMTLSVCGQWINFPSERAFYRSAEKPLREAFPDLPNRSQFNRLQRAYAGSTVAFGLYLAELMQARECLSERVDSTAVITRDAKRRGAGWLAGPADIGWSNRVGCYEGMHLLVSIGEVGAITGSGFGEACSQDQQLLETFLAARWQPDDDLPMVGQKAKAAYIADKGFAGDKPHARWRELFDAEVITAPHQSSKRTWPKEGRRWLAHLRQLIESGFEKLLTTFRLARERPHVLSGLYARLAAKVSWHNFCIWLNPQLERAPLAFADLLDW